MVEVEEEKQPPEEEQIDNKICLYGLEEELEPDQPQASPTNFI